MYMAFGSFLLFTKVKSTSK